MYEIHKFPCLHMKFNSLIALLAGFLFYMGWWIMIDVNILYKTIIHNMKVYHAPGILGTIMMILINMIPNEILYDSHFYDSDTCCSPFVIKMFLFFTLMGSFGCLIGGTFILVNDFLLQPQEYQWPGYGIFLQNLFIFVSNILMRFCRKREY